MWESDGCVEVRIEARVKKKKEEIINRRIAVGGRPGVERYRVYDSSRARVQRTTNISYEDRAGGR